MYKDNFLTLPTATIGGLVQVFCINCISTKLHLCANKNNKVIKCNSFTA